MAKTKLDRKVNKVARDLNKSLAADVFGSRFQVRQKQKTRSVFDGWQYYLYELVDNEHPARNKTLRWFSGYCITTFSALHIEMNNFIITSDFWQKYRNEKKNIDF